MKLKFLIFVMALAAMGPAREAPPPSPAEAAPSVPMSPEDLPAAAAPEPARPELVEYAAGEVAPDDFLWKARPVVVFAETPDDPAFREQMQALRSRPDMLVERDVVVIADADPAANSAWRRQLHPRGFSLVIMDKDGQVKLRKPLPWDVREISRAIDKFPLRRQEIGRAGVTP
ncbi:DUF4174 domain-containing protein [Paracoccus marinaquae]|uniref:DUF4174 domain-containing protein n=1 Tax=Paracoccus marinaquae TaxID=2841926 RepID=A0ABS6AFH4_9RHOB|nr:DUF4174 domain-containing protein [Paracoccus marinaquae]MBU3029268.1 DUF4174 domain-containing protein [Paracoccus marinaquae]